MEQAKKAYEEGEMAEALEILEKLAEAGDPEAQLLTARIYQLDRGGVPRDDQKAASWFERAALQGVAAAQLRLAELMETGTGLPIDARMALVWALRAEQLDMPGAPEASDRISAGLTEQERLSAQAEALIGRRGMNGPARSAAIGEATRNGAAPARASARRAAATSPSDDAGEEMSYETRRRKAAAGAAVLCIVGTVLVVIPTSDLSYAFAGLGWLRLAGRPYALRLAIRP